MLSRLLALTMLITVVASAVSAKPKLNPDDLMRKSDALYYYPAAHGLKDLAVDIVIDQLATDAIAKSAQISFYATGDKQRFAIEHVPDKYTRAREELLALVEPLTEYVMPHPSAATFTGLTLKARSVTRQLSGLPGTNYVELVGTSTDENAMVKEYHVLLDAMGLAHQVENVLKDGNTIIARIENTRIGESWSVAKVTTRLTTPKGLQWKIDTVKYETVEGYTLPVQVTVQYRDTNNQTPKGGLPDLTFRLQNYRINKGEAEAALKTVETTPALAAPIGPVEKTE